MNLAEAFKKLNLVESSEFDINSIEGKNALDEFLDEIDNDEVEQDVNIIDPNAETELDLEDSYIGKAVVQCPVCKSLIYRNMEEINDLGEETCPYCYSEETFDIIGKIVPIDYECEENEDTDEVAEVEEETETVVEESCSEKNEDCCPECGKNPCECEKEEKLEEDLENVTIETEDEVITVSSEEKEDTMVEPALDMAEEPEVEEETETAEVIAPLDDVEEIDEESFDEMVESWLTEEFSNIKSYKTNKFTAISNGRNIKVEGVVTLKNNEQRLTEFVVRPNSKKTSCLVENLQLKKRRMFGLSAR